MKLICLTAFTLIFGVAHANPPAAEPETAVPGAEAKPGDAKPKDAPSEAADAKTVYLQLDGKRYLPHEAWLIVRTKYAKHFDKDGNPLPGAEKLLPHEAWHVVQQRKLSRPDK